MTTPMRASNPFDVLAGAPASSEASDIGSRNAVAQASLFGNVKSAPHASALRSILVGRSSDLTGGSGESDAIVPGCSASAGVFPGSASVSLLSVALDVLVQSVKPGSQSGASRKAVQAAAEGGLWAQLASFIAWAVPLHSARASIALAALSTRAVSGDLGAAILPAVGADCAALSSVQRLRLYLVAPLSVAALRLIALAAATDPGTQLLIDQPQTLVPIIRAARTPWPGAPLDEPLASDAEIRLPWVPSARMCYSAGLRISEPALDVLLAIAPVFALRQPLLDLGVPPLLMQVATGGPVWAPRAQATDASGALTENTAAAFSPRLSSMALAALLARRPDRLVRASTGDAAAESAEDEVSSFDLEDTGTGAPPDATHVLWLWPLRLAAEDCLRILCDKSGSTTSALSDAAVASPAPTMLQRSSRVSVMSAGFALIAEEAAAELETDDGDAAGSLTPSPLRSPSASPLRKKSVGVAKAALFRSAGAAVVAAQSLVRLSSGSGSFAVSAAERSVRGAPPLVNHLQVRRLLAGGDERRGLLFDVLPDSCPRSCNLSAPPLLQATTAIANVVRNLLTPGVYRLLCPSALESLAAGGSSASTAPRSVVRILRGTAPTELPHLIWTPEMLARLQARLSQVRRRRASRLHSPQPLPHPHHPVERRKPPSSTASSSPWASASASRASTLPSPSASVPLLRRGPMYPH